MPDAIDSLPLQVRAGFDPHLAFAFDMDTQNRINKVFADRGNLEPSLPKYQSHSYNQNQLFDGEFKLNGDFNLEDALFSNDFNDRQQARLLMDHYNQKDIAYQMGTNAPNLYEHHKSMDKYVKGQFGYNPRVSLAQNDDYYYQNEYLADGWAWRNGKNVGRFLGRTVGSAVLKFGQTLGFLGSMINPTNWDEDFITKVADNSFSRALEDAENWWKQAGFLDVYHSLDYDNKGFFSKLLDWTFWNESVSDGIAFMASAAVPGVGLAGRGASLVGKSGRFLKGLGSVTKTLTGAERIGGVGAWAANTASESMFEARGGV